MIRTNKYNSVVETFVSNAVFNDLLSNKATPPADLTFAASPANDFAASEFIYTRDGVTGAANRYGKFEINDIPRILGYGLMCNLAGSLVVNDTDPEAGLSVSLQWNSYDAGDVLVQSNFTQVGTAPLVFKQRIYALNTIYTCDYRFDFSDLDTTADHYRGLALVRADSGATFATTSLNPSFASKQLIFWPIFIIEHSRQLRQNQSF